MLNTYLKGYKDIYLWGGKKIVEEHGKTPTVFPPAVERCKIEISWGDLAIYR